MLERIGHEKQSEHQDERVAEVKIPLNNNSIITANTTAVNKSSTTFRFTDNYRGRLFRTTFRLGDNCRGSSSKQLQPDLARRHFYPGGVLELKFLSAPSFQHLCGIILATSRTFDIRICSQPDMQGYTTVIYEALLLSCYMQAKGLQRTGTDESVPLLSTVV